MEERAWQEVLERLARIETKLDNYESIREKAEQAHLIALNNACLLYTSPSPRDGLLSRMPSSA